MKTSANGRHLIEQFEGLFLYTYGDQGGHRGVPTIGYGHTTAAGPPAVHYGMTIMEPEADQILAADLASVEVDVNRLVKAKINQNQFDALVSFTFNEGAGALARSNVLHAVNSGHFNQVAECLMAWVYGGGHVMTGLQRRRRAEGVLFNKPVAP